MWDNVNQARRSQRMAALCAICILAALVIPFAIGGSAADWLNASLAPDAINDKYKEVDGTAVTSFGTGSAYASYYVWKNASGETNKNNVTIAAGVVTLTAASTAGNTANESNIVWTQMVPEYRIYLTYTAKQAYADGLSRIQFDIAGLHSAGNRTHARVVTLSVGDIVLFTQTIAATDSTNRINQTLDISTNDLRRAIINAGDEAFMYLTVTAQDASGNLDLSEIEFQLYNVEKLIARDDALTITSVFAVVIVWAGILLVQPRYSLPVSKKNIGKGGF
jgi:hypothetical protein